MKKLFHTSIYRPMKFVYVGLFLTLFTFTGCRKFDFFLNHDEDDHENNYFMNSDEQFRKKYSEVNEKTLWELQQVRAATKKYRNIENAIKDGYADISVDVQNMGHHYMKATIVDAVFDINKPEILVYNKNHTGNFDLVAAEYAVPIDISPNSAPEGFTGTGDVWDRNTGFGLWLLHAWVWHYNPEGVFNPTNSLVHLH